MKGVHSTAQEGRSVPTEGQADSSSHWDAVEAEVLAALQPVVERRVKDVTDRIYDDLLTTTQEYLQENLRWNIASRLASAEAGRRAEWERAEGAERRALEFEVFARSLATLTTGKEWVGMGRKFNPDEAVTAIDSAIMRARALIAKAGTASSVGRSEATAPNPTGESTQ